MSDEKPIVGPSGPMGDEIVTEHHLGAKLAIPHVDDGGVFTVGPGKVRMKVTTVKNDDGSTDWFINPEWGTPRPALLKTIGTGK